ncbi:MAG TPA: GNAT family N-acetyltransferase, partial [Gaiellaceae bacterium]|nr:GNAT family N-acetyltransferase [Gaiellaceae bacterium]
MDDGLRLRAPAREEAHAITDLVVACDVDEVGEPDFELDDLLVDWNRPGFRLEHDAVVVEDGGTIVAYAALVRRDHADVYVHPEHRGRGIGS